MRIPGRLLQAIEAHAAEGYPLEVCGVLLGRRERGSAEVEAVERVVNRERESPRLRYEIAPEDLIRLQREARERGQDIIGYYHSHPDHPARPSSTDRQTAAEGLSDGVIHVVVEVDGAGRTSATAWVFRDTAQDFDPEPLDVD